MTTDALKRRLQWAPPDPRCNRLEFTAGDYAVFEALDRHGPLPTHYLYEFQKHHRRDYTNFQKRLTKLYHGSVKQGQFLVRPPQRKAQFNAHARHEVHELGPKARLLLAERGTPCRHPPQRAASFLHQLMQACVGASLELLAPAKGLRYIRREEILLRSKGAGARDAKNPMAIPLPPGNRDPNGRRIVPDDLFAFEYPGTGFRFFAVEIDRNTESIERTRAGYNTFGNKVGGYLDILRNRRFKAWWGIPNLTVLTVTTNATHARNLIDYVRQHGDPKFAERFAFAWEPSFGANWRVPSHVLSQLLAERWATPNGSKNISSA